MHTACSSADEVCKCLGSGDYSIGSLAGRHTQPGLSLPFSVACLEGVAAHTCSPFTLLRIKAEYDKGGKSKEAVGLVGPGSPGKGSRLLGAGAAGFEKGLSFEPALL